MFNKSDNPECRKQTWASVSSNFKTQQIFHFQNLLIQFKNLKEYLLFNRPS